MRETCARALAAALMTGAIATVVAMSALFGVAGEEGRPLSAPPSSLKRSVPVVAQAAVSRPRSVRSVSARPRAAAVTRHLVVARHWSPRPAARRFAAAKPKAKPKPAPVPESVAPTPAPAPEVAPPTVEAARIVELPQPPAPAPVVEQNQQGPSEDAASDHGKGRGHAYGHDKQDD